MKTLIDFARHGHYPRDTTIDVEGVEYDWQPDGRGKKWDTAAVSQVSIMSISFSVPNSDP